MVSGPSDPTAHPDQTAHDFNDLYFFFLCIVLAGYAMAGKGFAYVGIPPLLIGELTMALGLLAIFRSRCAIAMMANLPSIILAILLCMVVLKAVPAVRTYGINAIRDSVIILYGLYAFTIIALLIEKPVRLRWMIQRYSGFAWLYCFLAAPVVYILPLAGDYLPTWPTSGVTIINVRLGEAAVHLSGIAIFALLGMRKVSLFWTLILILSIVLISPSRGAMLACVVPIIAAAILSGNIVRFVPYVLGVVVLFFLAFAADLNIEISGGRQVGPRQLIDNIESIFGSSSAANLDGTKEWRLRWWKTIIDYTFYGPYFWTGKGFGMGLAEADGFVVGLETGGPIVRSPHNAQFTILARMGVPGLVLWLALLLSWFSMMYHNILVAQKRKDLWWANVFIWIACYCGSVVIDAAFDVAIEGPMLGIWFWSIFGFGIGASLIFRHELRASQGPYGANPL